MTPRKAAGPLIWLKAKGPGPMIWQRILYFMCMNGHPRLDQLLIAPGASVSLLGKHPYRELHAFMLTCKDFYLLVYKMIGSGRTAPRLTSLSLRFQVRPPTVLCFQRFATPLDAWHHRLECRATSCPPGAFVRETPTGWVLMAQQYPVIEACGIERFWPFVIDGVDVDESSTDSWAADLDMPTVLGGLVYPRYVEHEDRVTHGAGFFC